MINDNIIKSLKEDIKNLTESIKLKRLELKNIEHKEYLLNRQKKIKEIYYLLKDYDFTNSPLLPAVIENIEAYEGKYRVELISKLEELLKEYGILKMCCVSFNIGDAKNLIKGETNIVNQVYKFSNLIHDKEELSLLKHIGEINLVYEEKKEYSFNGKNLTKEEIIEILSKDI